MNRVGFHVDIVVSVVYQWQNQFMYPTYVEMGQKQGPMGLRDWSLWVWNNSWLRLCNLTPIAYPYYNSIFLSVLSISSGIYCSTTPQVKPSGRFTWPTNSFWDYKHVIPYPEMKCIWAKELSVILGPTAAIYTYILRSCREKQVSTSSKNVYFMWNIVT
jgi:hypothetical protein